MENKFKVGARVESVWPRTMGQKGKIVGKEDNCWVVRGFSGGSPSVNFTGCYVYDEINLTTFGKSKGRPSKPKPIVALVVWDEDRDPVKTFTKFSEAKKFAKELMIRPEVKKDSVVLYEVKKQYKMVAKTLNKLVQVK